ncbi:MAG TPA: SpoIID/LytB domain-containing protein, partial [Terriglobia bacterium]|nr:SpoIID/LytB domain-containing protein [Terriglobia bacterium]
VEGVLAGEAGIFRNHAALQAMAILARTWALRYVGRHRAQGFDFCSLTHCQVFRLPRSPRKRYSPKIIDATRTTEGLILKYRGRLADPYFTAVCGGETEAAANVWPDRGEPYLVSIHDSYCAASAHSSWQRKIQLDRIAPILRRGMGLSVRGNVSDMRVATRDSSGRVRTLEVLAARRFLVDANQFRYAVGEQLGWDLLKSNLYSVRRSGDELVFDGRGLGHGVGLCQAGADGMAGLGASYREILAHYFPGTTVEKFGMAVERASDPIASSEHFELAYPETQRRWVNHALNQLESWRRVLAQYAGPPEKKVHVETWNTTLEFIRATGQPGWVAGSSDGKSIFLQPLATLAAKSVLVSTLRHELTHLILHRLRTPGVPEWYEEGLVLYLTGEPISSGAPMHASARALGQSLARPRSAAEMHAAYARAALLVRRLAGQRGPGSLWEVLEHPSPDDLKWLKRQEATPLAP